MRGGRPRDRRARPGQRPGARPRWSGLLHDRLHPRRRAGSGARLRRRLRPPHGDGPALRRVHQRRGGPRLRAPRRGPRRHPPRGSAAPGAPLPGQPADGARRRRRARQPAGPADRRGVVDPRLDGGALVQAGAHGAASGGRGSGAQVPDHRAASPFHRAASPRDPGRLALAHRRDHRAHGGDLRGRGPGRRGQQPGAPLADRRHARGPGGA